MKKLVSFALDSQAVYLVLAHNHPNGAAYPSRTDILITQKIVRTLAPLGIGVCDHIVTSGRDFYSFNKHREFSAERDEEMLVAAQYSMQPPVTEEL